MTCEWLKLFIDKIKKMISHYLGLGGSGGWYPDKPDPILLDDLKTGVLEDVLEAAVKNVGTWFSLLPSSLRLYSRDKILPLFLKKSLLQLASLVCRPDNLAASLSLPFLTSFLINQPEISID